MRCVICTLFEHHYHLGLAVFVNSLCRWGYKGKVYAGYRGPLPPWAESGAKTQANGHIELQVSPEILLIFVPLQTTVHLTNYKPDFMLQVEGWAAAETDALVYLDPDIVLDIDWSYFEDWLTCGIAVCEDINSPLPENHPARVGWRRFYKEHGHDLRFRSISYANGGFVGLKWEHRRFLILWQEFMAHMSKSLGGGEVAGIQGGKYLQKFYGFADCFGKTDQDALNATMEASPDIPVSFWGREAMGFQPGRHLLPHAVGYYKPWNRPYIRMALSGTAPTRVEKLFWSLAEGPLRPYSPISLAFNRFRVAISSALGRFIRRTN